MEFRPQLFLIFIQKTVRSHLKYWRLIKKLYVTLLFFLPILLANLLIWAQVVMLSSSNIALEASHMGLFFSWKGHVNILEHSRGNTSLLFMLNPADLSPWILETNGYD